MSHLAAERRRLQLIQLLGSADTTMKNGIEKDEARCRGTG